MLMASCWEGFIRDCRLPRRHQFANILDRPENVAQPMLCAAIKEAIERFEPRATYMGTTFKEAPDTPGRMLPVVEVSISA